MSLIFFLLKLMNSVPVLTEHRVPGRQLLNTKSLCSYGLQEGFCQLHNHLSEVLCSQKKTVGLSECSDLCSNKQYLQAECFQGVHIPLETLATFYS